MNLEYLSQTANNSNVTVNTQYLYSMYQTVIRRCIQNQTMTLKKLCIPYANSHGAHQHTKV